MSKPILDGIARDLARFEERLVLSALERCRLEIPRFPTIAEVVARIPDGRPAGDEAWAMCPKDERDSVVWTSEMAEAFGIARPLLLSGDDVGARMAFRDAYVRILAEARAKGRPVSWVPSLGSDRHGREAAIKAAVEARRITMADAQALIPDLGLQEQKQISQSTRALEGPNHEQLSRLDASEQLRQIRERIEGDASWKEIADEESS